MITCWPSLSAPSSSAALLPSLAPSLTATGFGRPSSPTSHTVADALEEAASFALWRPDAGPTPFGRKRSAWLGILRIPPVSLPRSEAAQSFPAAAGGPDL